MRKIRGRTHGNCGHVEIIRKWKTSPRGSVIRKSICGYIKCNSIANGRELTFKIKGAKNIKEEIKDFQHMLLDVFNNLDNYDIGWKRRPDKRDYEDLSVE